MFGRAILLLGRRGWLYLILTAFVLTPLWVLRSSHYAAWNWTPAWLAAVEGPDKLWLFLGLALQMTLAVLPLAFLPYLVLLDRTNVLADGYAWTLQCALRGFAGSALGALFIIPATMLGLVAGVGSDSFPLALTVAGLVLVGFLHVYGKRLVQVQAQVVDASGRSGRRPPPARSQAAFVWISRVASLVFFGLYLASNLLVPVVLPQSLIDRLEPRTAMAALTGIEALCLVLWSVFTSLAWYEAFGPIESSTTQDFVDTFR